MAMEAEVTAWEEQEMAVAPVKAMAAVAERARVMVAASKVAAVAEMVASA